MKVQQKKKMHTLSKFSLTSHSILDQKIPNTLDDTREKEFARSKKEREGTQCNKEERKLKSKKQKPKKKEKKYNNTLKKKKKKL